MTMANETFNDVVMEFTVPGDRPDEFFDDAMDAAVEALEKHAKMVALGPCAAADTERGVVRVRCTVAANAEDADDKVKALVGFILKALRELGEDGDVRRTKLEISEEVLTAA